MGIRHGEASHAVVGQGMSCLRFRDIAKLYGIAGFVEEVRFFNGQKWSAGKESIIRDERFGLLSSQAGAADGEAHKPAAEDDKDD